MISKPIAEWREVSDGTEDAAFQSILRPFRRRWRRPRDPDVVQPPWCRLADPWRGCACPDGRASPPLTAGCRAPREGQAPIGLRDRLQPVAQRVCLRGSFRCDVLEYLEGVPRSRGLAFRRAQVGFQAPAAAAVGVTVAVQGGQHGGGIGLDGQQLGNAR